MVDNAASDTDHVIYRDFCNGMKNQSREQIRLAGDIARRLPRGISNLSRSGDALQTSINNFCQIDSRLENIDNNLNKLSALTKSYK
jgi:hypothetical protein